MRIGSFLLVVIAVTTLLGACGGSDDGDAGGAASGDVSAGGEAQYGGDGARLRAGRASRQMAALPAEEDGAGGSATRDVAIGRSIGERPVPPLREPNQRVIKTADLELEVRDGDFRDALQDTRAVANRFGGFVLSTSVDGTGARTGSLAMRVPSRRFEGALSALEDLGKVTGERVSGEDVGEEFVDLQARLRNLLGQEQVLLRLYDEATTVADTIRIQREVEGVQLEIERIRGRLRYLEDQTDLSTIHVSITEAGAAVNPKGTLTKAWEQAQEIFLGVLSAAIVGLGFLFPVALLAATVYFLVRVLGPRIARQQL